MIALTITEIAGLIGRGRVSAVGTLETGCRTLVGMCLGLKGAIPPGLLHLHNGYHASRRASVGTVTTDAIMGALPAVLISLA